MALGLKLQLLKKEIIKIGSADQQCIQMNNPACWRRKKFSTYLCAGQRLLEAQKEPNVVYAFKIKKGHIFFSLISSLMTVSYLTFFHSMLMKRCAHCAGLCLFILESSVIKGCSAPGILQSTA